MAIDTAPVVALVILVDSGINSFVDWVLNAAMGESTIQDSSTVLLVPLPEASVLVELIENLVESWNRVVVLQVLKLLLDVVARHVVESIHRLRTEVGHVALHC